MFPQPLTEQQKKDSDNINLLSIFQFIFAGLTLVSLAFLYLHYLFMHEFLMKSEVWKQMNMNITQQQLFAIVIGFYWVAGVLMFICSLLNVLSGIFMRQRKARVFSLVVAALNCLHIPLGTLLGIFTLVILSRYSVAELYRTKPANSEGMR